MQGWFEAWSRAVPPRKPIPTWNSSPHSHAVATKHLKRFCGSSFPVHIHTALLLSHQPSTYPSHLLTCPYPLYTPQRHTNMFDLVVVGAGFSGLQAAYSAQQAGLSVAVLEARDRVGGKSWSVPLSNGRGVADMGAAWVNDTLQPRVWSYIKRFGLEGKIVKQRLGEKAVLMKEDGARSEFPQGTTPEVWRILQLRQNSGCS